MDNGYITLNNGVTMPKLGFGTIGQSGEALVDNVAFALNHGYDLIDTANRYGNETEVGEGLKKSGRKREEYFLETKLGPTLYENDRAVDDTLKRLQVDYRSDYLKEGQILATVQYGLLRYKEKGRGMAQAGITGGLN